MDIIKVLVVDDSTFFRNRISKMLNADPTIEVIGVATDGKDAVLKSKRLSPDVITMDLEMPVMDGVTAIKKILSTKQIPILMLSSVSKDEAGKTLDALDAGASDFLLKKHE